MEITKLTALELGKKIKEKEITVEEAVRAQLDKIKKDGNKYQSYITLMEDYALNKAKEVQERIDRGELKDSPLAGVPVAVKDNICTRGTLTTCASKILSNFTPSYHAEAVERLEAAGAIMIGKTNMDEFAMGNTSETSFFGETKNPWDMTRNPGGSSGGSAAAVSAEEAYYALGSDTGGSIRQPSSFCGITGIKPTYGTISRYGLISYASSLDQIGPMARNVSDCAAVLEVIAGYDKKDSTSVQRKDYKFMDALIDDVKGMKIGIPKEYLREGIEEEVREKVLEAAKVLENKGAVVKEFDMKMTRYAIPAYYVIASAEASSNLSRYDGIKYGYRKEGAEGLQEVYKKTRSDGFGEEVKRRIMIGTFVLSSGHYDAYYNKAQKVRELIKEEFDQVFEEYDIILCPTSPATAGRLGENGEDHLKGYLGDIYTVSVNLAGLPAISLPCGIDKKGLPIGVQMIGKAFGEKDIIRAAYSFEITRKYESPSGE